ncbi:transient receptor potential cation channel subfamily A member 1-like isoform X2 [Ruditapes philippinarum]|uniref:transient receptor potential cation channel subfamily A member 1-like isoform X2 n=1 Tax=Ruditapes philippinarum TaxID=129788 RepID=UPI00295A5750|nr:transient receptor potential cation channel subfamily A member 1-like isoform X2 [Ruditapes philippinarum]
MSDNFGKRRTSRFSSKSVKKTNILSGDDVNINLLCKTCKSTNTINHDSDIQIKRKLSLNVFKRRKPTEENKCVTEIFSETDIRIVISAASKGNLEEFQRLYESDTNRIHIKDAKGNTPIHKAAEAGRIKILEFIHEKGGDLNTFDSHRNTPLHLAVKNDQSAVVTFLLDHGADSTLLNDDHLAPIHLAVDVNARKALKALLAHANVDPNLKGEGGMRPLHYCAYKDRDECAVILLEHGTKPCIKCDNGFFPINIAGKCASAKTLEILIKHVESLGYKREDVLSFTDKENNMPLHCAVNSGDLKAVKVCLSAGAPVDAKQEDNSTPLHFACAQGSIDMVRMMQEMQPERFGIAIKSPDVLKMTPLHRAALFDHVSVVEFLIAHDADINAQDAHERTPLLLASSKGGWRTVNFLLKHNADIKIRDKENRNFLHLAIKYGVPIDSFGCAVLKDLKNLLNERDNFGCTPLHYASKEGHLVAIDDLIKLGATINPKDNDKKSPLHFAAKYGRYNTCRRLLDSEMGPNIINETDGDGLSTLHIASQNGHTKIITLLMQKGAYVTKDNMDNSPLHLAASNGYTRSMKLLLTVYPNLLDCCNKDKDTALHLASRKNHPSAVELLMTVGAEFTRNTADDTFMDIAIRDRHTEVAFSVIRHDRWEEVMKLCSKEFGTPMNGLVQCLPDACMAALDRCRTTSNHDRRSPDLSVHYNFKYLQCPLRYVKGKEKVVKHFTPMLALNTMVRHGRVQCLSHPVSEAYLNMKWRAYGSWFHISNLVFYLIFLALFTVLVTTCTFSFRDASSKNNSTINETDNTAHINTCHFKPLHKVSVYFVLIFCSLNMLKEIVQLIQQRKKYFRDFTNAIEWVLYGSAIVYIIPFIGGRTVSWQWEAGAIAVFLAWFNCLLYLQRFDFFGIYVVMFLEILRTLVQVLCVFSILLIAFSMAFFMLLNKETNNAFSTPGLSLLRTSMMMFELDFMASFSDPYTDDDSKSLYFGGATIFLLVIFVLLMPILLMNLLIGLAVGDIESVQKNATLKRLAMQVELHTDLERKLPFKILDVVDKAEYTFYPNKCIGHLEKIFSKMSFLGDNFEGDAERTLSHNALVYEEMYKQKKRIKDISSHLDKQYELLRLVVQKMEIHTEDENRDEGYSESFDVPNNLQKASKWAPARHNLVRQSAVVSQWKQSMSVH